MAHQKHKTPVPRILDIVRRLYDMEKLKAADLASEHDKDKRTIQRDLLLISQTIPLKNNGGVWELDKTSTPHPYGHFQQTLLGAFARNIDIEAECLHSSNLSPELVRFAVEYKRLPKKLGETIINAIEKDRQCLFTYVKPEGTSTRRIDPVKLYTQSGRWYVVARDYKNDEIRFFNLEKIKNLVILEEPRTLTPKMIEEAENKQSIWSSSGQDEYTVRLYIRPEIASYIRDIPLHKSQTIYDEHHDGGLEVHCSITHKLELLPQVKYWLPRIHILEPKWLWNDLMRDLEIYQDEDQKIQVE